MKQSYRIPTIIALILLLIGMSFVVVAGEQVTSLVTRASSSYAPSEITVTNIADSSVTINWVTQTPATSFVKLTKTGLSLKQYIATDIRDAGGVSVARQIHSAVITNLEPLNEYRFEIVSGGKTYNPKNATIKTGAYLTTPTQQINPAFGTLIDEQNQLVHDAIVYASFEGSQTVSTLVDNGSWILPLGTLRNREGTRYFIPQKSDVEQLSFVNNKAKAMVMTTIDNDSPLPAVRLGQDYNFTHKSVSTKGLIIAQAQTNPATMTKVDSNQSFTISAPLARANIPSGKPAFKGTGISGKFVILTITGEDVSPLSAKIVIDENNRWTWTPKTSLVPQEYQLTAASFTTTDKPVVLSQSFTILKSGTSVLQAATPAASLRPASPTPKPSFSPSPVASASPIPVTGNWKLTAGILLMAGGLMLTGILGILKTKKNYVKNEHETSTSDQQQNR